MLHKTGFTAAGRPLEEHRKPILISFGEEIDFIGYGKVIRLFLYSILIRGPRLGFHFVAPLLFLKVVLITVKRRNPIGKGTISGFSDWLFRIAGIDNQGAPLYGVAFLRIEFNCGKL
jgi:hypothetical protein